MAKFGTRDTQMLIDRLRMEAALRIEADETGSEVDLFGLLREAADTLDAANRYYAAVESALV